jgi:signal transduction histidine kinase
MFKTEARKKGICLNLPLVNGTEAAALGALCLRVDENKMGQVFRNLASNALKFTPSGGSITVKMTVRRKHMGSSSHFTDEEDASENSASSWLMHGV